MRILFHSICCPVLLRCLFFFPQTQVFGLRTCVHLSDLQPLFLSCTVLHKPSRRHSIPLNYSNFAVLYGFCRYCTPFKLEPRSVFADLWEFLLHKFLRRIK